MKQYFGTVNKTVIYNNETIENALIVNQFQYVDGTSVVPFGFFPYKEEYGNIMMKMFTFELNENEEVINEQFLEVEFIEEPQEETQLDRIEKGTTQLLADIQSQAIDEFTLELLESGVI